MTNRYITHASTANQLRDEFVSDITRRLDHLDSYLKNMRPNAAEASRVARARMELLDLLEFWKQIEIKSPNKQE